MNIGEIGYSEFAIQSKITEEHCLCKLLHKACERLRSHELMAGALSIRVDFYRDVDWSPEIRFAETDSTVVLMKRLEQLWRDRPDPGYVFTGWTGDATGADSPFALNMDSDKMVGATFGPDLSDVDNDGLTAYDEVVLHGTDPTIADTDGDGFSDSFELSSGFSAISTASTPESRSSIVLGSGDAEGSVEFRFNGAAGVSYRIEATTTLDDWGTLDALVIGTGGSMTKTYTMAGNPVRFFRLLRN
jgi:uncharacterized repeat protein (TIGR02543 family)